MLEYMLDTDTCIEVLRHRPAAVKDRFNQASDSLCLSTITLFELLRGARRSAQPDLHLRSVESFAARLDVLDWDARAAAHAAEIRVRLEQDGAPIGVYDLQIAAHARSQSLILVTGNLREFRRVDGLRIEDWMRA